MAYLENMEIVGRTESGKPIVRGINVAGNRRYAVGHYKKGVVAINDNSMIYERLCDVKEGRIASGSRSNKARVLTINDDEDE